jgi:hypothetical protein
MSGELGFTTATLPSRGVLYKDGDTGDDLLPGGEIQVRKLTAKEESILMNQGARGVERIAILLKNCTKLPSAKLTHDDLLITDRLAILLAMRTITFGPNYAFTFRCQFCGNTGKANVNIMDDLEERTPEKIAEDLLLKGKIESVNDFVLEEPFDVPLDDCGKVVSLRFLRGTDETRIVKRSKRMAMQSNDPSDPSYLYRIALQIVAIDGESQNIATTEAFVRDLTAGDTARIRLAVDDTEPGIDLKVFPTCPSCGGENERMMPFDAEFFRPSVL